MQGQLARKPSLPVPLPGQRPSAVHAGIQTHFWGHSPGCQWQNGLEPAQSNTDLLEDCDLKHTHTQINSPRKKKFGEHCAPLLLGIHDALQWDLICHRKKPAPDQRITPSPHLGPHIALWDPHFGKRLPRDISGSNASSMSVPQQVWII